MPTNPSTFDLGAIVGAIGTYDEAIGYSSETYLTAAIEAAETASKVIAPVITRARNVWVTAKTGREAKDYSVHKFAAQMAEQVDDAGTVKWTLVAKASERTTRGQKEAWARFTQLFTLCTLHTQTRLGTFQLWAMDQGKYAPMLADYINWLPTADRYAKNATLTDAAKAADEAKAKAKATAERKAEREAKARQSISLTTTVWDHGMDKLSPLERAVELSVKLFDLQNFVSRVLEAGGDEFAADVAEAVEAKVKLQVKGAASRKTAKA